MPTITGTSGPDSLTGTDDDDLIIGAGGFDTIIGRDGDDVIEGMGQLSGGEGDDRIVLLLPTSNIETSLISGNAGFDTLDLSRTPIVVSRAYSSIVSITAVGETVVGTATYVQNRGIPGPTVNLFTASDIERVIGVSTVDPTALGQYSTITYDLTGRTTPIEILGGRFAEILRGGAGRDILNGGGGNDTIFIGASDQAFGGDGNDRLTILSTDAIGGCLADGGAGADILDIQIVGAFDGLNLATGGSAAFRIADVETVNLIQNVAYTGQTFVTTLIGDNANNILRFTRAERATAIETTITIHGGGGNDTIESQGTNDLLYGDEGDDIITGIGRLDGGAGNDILQGSGQLFGGSGDDMVTVSVAFPTGNSRNFSLEGFSADGGDGIDTLQMLPAGSFSFNISLRTGTATATPNTSTYGIVGSLALTGFENLIGGNNDDVLEGDDGVNLLIGGRGADIIRGGGGNDVIYGWGGTQPYGLPDNDKLFGEAGDDIIYGEIGNDVLDGGTGSDQLFGDVGDDILLGQADDDQLFGGDGADRLEGGDGNDYLDGGAGVDDLVGGAGDDVMIGGAGLDSFDGGEGHDMVILDFISDLATFTYENGAVVISSPQGREVLTGVEQVNFTDAIYLLGSDGRMTRAQNLEQVGDATANQLTGTASADRLVGLAGDDFLVGAGGNDMLDGGSGIDTAGYYSLMRSYRIVQVNNSLTMVAGGVEGGADLLTSIERLSFLDGTIYADADSFAASLYRLYDATFDRAPDQAGLSGWVGRLESGTTLAQAAQVFATAPEFIARYGNLSNEDFVKTMYRFSLNREGDAPGVASWTARMNDGASRGSILLAFSESVEHRNLMAPAISAGIFVQDDRTMAVARLFDAAFDRLPDREGIAYWRGTLETGGSLFAIANAFVSSQEFQDRYGALNNQQFIEQLYRFTLNRDADALGLQVWTDRLNAGTTRAEMVVIFSESAEHVALTAPMWQGGVRYLGGPMTAPDEDTGTKTTDALTLPDDGFMPVEADDDAIVFDLQDDDGGFVPPIAVPTGDDQLQPLDVQPVAEPVVLSGNSHHTDWM